MSARYVNLLHGIHANEMSADIFGRSLGIQDVIDDARRPRGNLIKREAGLDNPTHTIAQMLIWARFIKFFFVLFPRVILFYAYYVQRSTPDVIFDYITS